MLKQHRVARRGRRAAGLALALAVSGTTSASVVLTTASADAATTTPSIVVSADARGVAHYRGPATLRAGLVKVTFRQSTPSNGFEIWRLNPGYSFAQFTRDAGRIGSDLTAAKRALKNAHGYGGFATDGSVVTGTLDLNRAGHYVAFQQSDSGFRLIKNIRVTGTPAHRTAPRFSATVTMLTGSRFGGASVLPAKGSIRVKNLATDSPHILMLQHVADGTTRDQVMNALAPDGRLPAFLRAGVRQTGGISTGNWQTMTYSLPKGTYVEMCFFPDLRTGMPHAMMGMVRIVRLK